MNKFYILLISALTIISCSKSPEGYVLTGIDKNLTDQTVIFLSRNNVPFDSVKVKNGQFVFKGKLENDYEILSVHTKDYKAYRQVWLVNKSVTIDADASHKPFNQAPIIGSYIQDQNDEMDAEVEIWDEKGDSIRSILKNLELEDSLRAPLKEEMDWYRKKQSEAEINFVKNHPDYQLSSYLLTFIKSKLSKDEIKILYEGLTDPVKKNNWGQAISYYLEKSVDLKIGDKAVDFTLLNQNNENTSLSSFKGKYVLLEFWANWCLPCRKENPNLLNAYRQYQEQGFEILGVSLDINKKDWHSVLVQDSISWTTVSDLKGMESKVAITYKVSYLPKNYLIDREGIVIALDLRGDKLQEKLALLLD